LPQPPQFFVSEETSEQPEAQVTSPAGHAHWLF
jgi:hypothetical protein